MSDKHNLYFCGNWKYPEKDMAMSKSVRMGSVVTGCLLLVLTLISVICAGIVISKMKVPEVPVSVGFWGLYVSTQV